MRSMLPLVILASLLTGCGAVGNCSALPMPDYDPAFKERLADELDTAPAGAAWPVAVVDYVQLRDAVRACQK